MAADLKRDLGFKVKRNVILKVPLLTAADKGHLRCQIQDTIMGNTHTPPLLSQYLCECIQIVSVRTPPVSTFFSTTNLNMPTPDIEWDGIVRYCMPASASH